VINGGLLCTGPWADNPPGDEGELGGLGRFRLGFACPFFMFFFFEPWLIMKPIKLWDFCFNFQNLFFSNYFGLMIC
jgi:hypothetical protein